MEREDQPSPMFLPLILTTLGLALAGPFTSCPGGYKNGEKIKEGSFVKQCSVSANAYSIDIVGCLTSKGTEVPIGSKVDENNMVFNCIETEGGGARIETGPAGGSSAGSTAPKENMKCDGKYVNGQKYNQGLFVKKCISSPTSWSINAVACLTPSGKEVAIGGKVDDGRLTYSCVETDEGLKIETDSVASSGPGENLKCKDKYSNGEKFNEGSFVKKCSSTPYSYSILIFACLTPSGKELAIGSSTEEGKLVYNCVATEKGAKIETDLATKGCEDGKYTKGQSYLSANKRFLLKCVDDYGSNEIIACKTDEGKEVKVGSELVVGDFKYKCVQESNGSVRYLKEPINMKTAPKGGCGQYAVGETILSKDKKFKFTCVSEDNVKFTSCIVEGGEVKADTQKTIGVWSFNCKTSSNGGATLTRKRIE